MAEPVKPVSNYPTPTNPFVGLLRSRKFWVAIFALGVTIATTYANIPPAIIAALDGVFAAVIASIAYEDAHAQ